MRIVERRLMPSMLFSLWVGGEGGSLGIEGQDP